MWGGGKGEQVRARSLQEKKGGYGAREVRAGGLQEENDCGEGSDNRLEKIYLVCLERLYDST